MAHSGEGRRNSNKNTELETSTRDLVRHESRLVVAKPDNRTTASLLFAGAGSCGAETSRERDGAHHKMHRYAKRQGDGVFSRQRPFGASAEWL